MEVLIVLLVLLWLALGASSPFYFWKRDFGDYRGLGLLPVLAAIMGPLSWLVGYMIHDRS